MSATNSRVQGDQLAQSSFVDSRPGRVLADEPRNGFWIAGPHATEQLASLGPRMSSETLLKYSLDNRRQAVDTQVET
jgi:hypothetical protein